MAFVRPVTKTIISTTEFGQEVYDRLQVVPVVVAGKQVTLPATGGLGASPTQVTALALTFTPRANRAYRVEYVVPFAGLSGSQGGNLVYIDLAGATGTSLGNASHVTSPRAGSWGMQGRGSTLFTKVLGSGLTGATVTLTPRIFPAIAADVQVTGTGWIVAIDMGPD